MCRDIGSALATATALASPRCSDRHLFNTSPVTADMGTPNSPNIRPKHRVIERLDFPYESDTQDTLC